MPSPAAATLRRLAPGLERFVAGVLSVAARVLPVLPADLVLALADVLGTLYWLIDRRGRSVGAQNLEAVFGSARSRAERGRILRASYRNAIRCEVLLFHAQPMTPARFARWVRVGPNDLATLREHATRGWRGVLASAHLGNWELLLLARRGLSFAPEFAYLAEATGSKALDAALERLRDGGEGGAMLRKSGALALRSALAQGKSVSLMMDRNLRGERGGDYVPFLGLLARTTPLAARLARGHGVPLVTCLLLPAGPRTWRFRFSEYLMPPDSADPDADAREGLRRANAALSAAILEFPEAYLWTLKRFKSRPTPEQGRYPAYSFYDPP